MKIFCDITINLPRDAVVAYFSDPKIIPEWQKGFVRMEYVSGQLGKPGNVHKLIYNQNGQLAATTAQEGLMRPYKKKEAAS